MTFMKLTGFLNAVTGSDVNYGRKRAGRMTVKAGVGAVSAMALSGCINVAAPEEPIVIELNINIRQEVIYRLAEDAANTIDENADIF
ncbi:YnbE family lipoprotein [Erythrobacter crassostreae]|uniref:YnbE family lipoprotein n=1 Tax=Erythrobacter crassostreae TaxID=2828328 RepID=A0A9X1JLK7_9SPHN|nr:YnbE family lipoprotein [Erythrobacter crassostrea]MBV7260156.1 YnbE family lipoprotein [Erythrobacter crassostrea]